MSASNDRPAVRIVHRGGPARLAIVYINGHEAPTATRAEIVLDANQKPGVHARIEFVGRPPIESTDVQLDVSADDAEMVEREPVRLRPFVILTGGLTLSTIPAAFAWWMWQLGGWWAALLFVLTVICGGTWTLGTLWAAMGAGLAGHKPADDGDE